jgi:predicted nucleic acid-binding protein
VIFDTDILIWIQRGNEKAAALVDKTSERYLSVFSQMELLQAAANKKQHRVIKDFLKLYGFQILPLTENIGHRASIYIEEYSLSSGLRAGDAIVAATATENNMTLATGNRKHFKPIKDLALKIFKAT